MATNPKVVVSAQVDEAVRARLAELAAEHDRTLSAQVRRVLNAHVQRDEHEDDE
jgi:predicted transcriptional regulator